VTATAVAHTGLTVSDLAASLAFWRDGLGMREAMSQEKRGGYLEAVVREPGAHVRMVQLEFPGGGSRIELFQYLAPAGGRVSARPADVGFAHVCIACTDVDELLERLVAAGGTPLGEPADIDTGANRGGRCVYIRDPDGHTVELFSEAREPAEAADLGLGP
jgi:catechol 2,3-dioxygenase-like lactoylglutathione lyase family enzyme